MADVGHRRQIAQPAGLFKRIARARYPAGV